jgi:hypothetical protein
VRGQPARYTRAHRDVADGATFVDDTEQQGDAVTESEHRVQQIIKILERKLHEEHGGDFDAKVEDAISRDRFDELCRKRWNPTWGEHDYAEAVKQLAEKLQLQPASGLR